MENPTKYSLNVLNEVHEAIANSFDYDLTPRQIGLLINRQPKNIIDALIKDNGYGVSIDNLINEISKKITGDEYPLPGEPEHHKSRFFIKLNIKKVKYFEPIFKVK